MSVNAYAYCENNSINCEDPLGLSKTVNLKKGWKYRIDSTNSNTKSKRHIHIYKGKEIYSQNDDGSPHDGSTGSPPNSVKKELKEKSGWDWDAKEKDYQESLNALEETTEQISLDLSDLGDVIVATLLIVMTVTSGIGLIFLIFALLEIAPPTGLPA